MTVIKMNDENKANIIAKYEQGMTIANIANSTIYFRLAKWGVKIRKHGGVRRRRGRPARQKRRFSPELQAIMAENSRINDEHITHCEFEHSTEDQLLVSNIIQHPILG